METGLRLLVGLGNPGRRYDGTRHNLGFDWVARLAEALGAEWRPFKDLGEVALAAGAPGLVLARPSTFMNLSGRMAAALCYKHSVAPGQVLVGMDEMSLPLGQIRLRASGSAGGHNGLQSVLDELGTKEVPRLRMGIGAAPPGDDAAEFVLRRFLPEERPAAAAMLGLAVEAARAALDKGLERAMTDFNAVKNR